MKLRLMAGAVAVAAGAAVALSVAQQQPRTEPAATRAQQRATVVVYKSPT